MSSYLNLYLRTKEKNDKKSEDLFFMSFSRNSEVYSYINEELPNLYSSEGQLKEITTTSISNIIRELEETLKEQYEIYQVYKDCKKAQSAIETKKYIRELRNTLGQFNFISLILMECSFDYTDFKGLYGFID